MIPKELARNIRRIQITTNRLVTDIFAGQYHSVFKGRGIEFDEVREYAPGDDIRTIDWNVTARTGRPHVKKYIEEREMTVMLLVDVSASNRFSTTNLLKNRLAAEVAALLGFSAIRNNDKVGLLMFSEEVEKFIPPRKGITHTLRVVREALYASPRGVKTSLKTALETLMQVSHRRTISFLISDFIDPDDPAFEGEPSFRSSLAVANHRHDVIAVVLEDPGEVVLPRAGIVALEDPEEGGVRILDTSSPSVRSLYEKEARARIMRRRKFFQRLGVDTIELSTDRSYVQEFIRFFQKRQQRFR